MRYITEIGSGINAVKVYSTADLEALEAELKLFRSLLPYINLDHTDVCKGISRPHMHRGENCDVHHPCDCGKWNAQGTLTELHRRVL